MARCQRPQRKPRAREPQIGTPTIAPCTPSRVCCVWVAIRTRSTANERGSTKWRGARDAAIRGKVAAVVAQPFAQHRVRVPCTVVLTRCSDRLLDSDNAESALKRARDGVADALKIDDGDPRVLWVVAQRKTSRRERGVLVEVYAPGSAAETLVALGPDWMRRNAHALDAVLPLLRGAK